MRTITASVVLLGFAAAVCGQAPSPSAAPGAVAATSDAALAQASPAWQAFLQEQGGYWTSQWCAATGTPRSIYGQGLPLADWRGSSLQEGQRQADAVLQRYSALLGLGGSDFVIDIAGRMGNAWTFSYDQYFHRLPVIGGRADVRINQCGVLAWFGSVAFQVPPNFATRPLIDELNAARIAWGRLEAQPNAVPQPGKPRATRLVIWGDVDSQVLAPVFLAWEVPVSSVDANGHGPVGRYYIDAQNGAVLHYRNDKHECGFDQPHEQPHGAAGTPAAAPALYTVMGFARNGPSCTDPGINVPLPGLEVNVPGVGIVITDVNGQFTTSVASPTSVTVNMNGIHNQLILGINPVTQPAVLQPGTPSTIQVLTAAATDAQLAHTTCYLWVYRVNDLLRSIVGNTTQMAGADQVVPTVNIASTCNAYYVNNTINFYLAGGGCNNTASSSVVAHEWGHGVDERYGGLSQIDGLSEGWGDICSEYLLDNPIIGPGFFTTGAGIRTGLNTAQFPVSSGDPHAQGETFMGFAWLYRENLRTAFGTTLAIAISNADVLGSIPANAQNQTDAIIAVFVADDDDGNLANGVPHYNQLVPACQAHNLPFPGIQAGTVTHVQIGNTSDQLTPRTVLASAVPTFGSFTALTVFYNDGSSHTRSMIPTGTANQYQALLPGLLPPATMTYHIEALHSTGIIYRLPVLGEYSTRVIGQSRIVLDDFENGGIGWTHGLITGEDDWQIGTPTGQSGAGWTDPPSAYSGTQCAGNDLGIGGSDGAYSNNVENWLRSPVFNCTGRTGVRLRFKRWLTVDRGSLDLASIRFGTAFVWVNPTATAQLDTGWTQFDMPVGLADNNPNVQFEWRLRSNGTVTFGGWAIDDFELVDATPSPLPAQLQILPEQAVQGSPMTLSINTGAPRPFLFILGSTGGPTTIPGVPLILVGGTTVSVPGFTNASGLMTVPFTAPAGVPVTGLPWFSQVLTLDATSNIVASNQFLNLFTN